MTKLKCIDVEWIPENFENEDPDDNGVMITLQPVDDFGNPVGDVIKLNKISEELAGNFEAGKFYTEDYTEIA